MISAVFADGRGNIMAGVVVMELVENEVEEVVVVVVLVGVVEVRLMAFLSSQKPSLLGNKIFLSVNFT